MKKMRSNEFSFQYLLHMPNYKNLYNEYKTKYSLLKNRFDYIVVGGGSAGAVIASRLSEMDDKTILLLEAGIDFNKENIPEDLKDPEIIASDKYDWDYTSEPNKFEVVVDLPRAKAMGGCSSHNAAAAIRATRYDLDNWGLDTWKFDDCLEYFKKLETSNHGDAELHGKDGPFPVNWREKTNKLSEKFIESAINYGYTHIDDFNGLKQNGVGLSSNNIKDGVRQNTNLAYLNEHVRKRKNLNIFSNTTVDKVIFEGTKAIGVVLKDKTNVFANDEIILCGGAVGSPIILQRSGIGNRNLLERLGIKMVKELPIGESLYDHALYYDSYKILDKKYLDDVFHVGTLLWTNSNGDKDTDRLNMQIIVFPDELDELLVGVAVTIPRSVGFVMIKDADCETKPEIQPNYFNNDDDIDSHLAAVKIARKICESEPIRDVIKLKDKPIDITLYESYGHMMGSVPLGKCLDHDCRVLGINGLRVVDASIFPKPLSTPLNLTVIMCAEKVSDIIKKDSELKKIDN